MNKLFDFHLEGEETNRPYYLGSWEPIEVDAFRLLPFQIKTNSSDYTITQVTFVSDYYDFTSIMPALDYHNGYLTYDGSNFNSTSVTGYDNPLKKGMCYFKITSNNVTYFSDICNVGETSGMNTNNIPSSIPVSSTYDTSKFHAKKGDYIWVNHVKGTSYGFDFVYLYDVNGVSVGEFSVTNDQNFVTWDISAPYAGEFYIHCVRSSGGTAITNLNFSVYGDYSRSRVLLRITSTVDYADIYYKGGFTQELYRLANVRRSPEPKITVIGEERNGIIVREKVITATKYKCVMKINEAMLNALTTAVGANVTITDQTGHEFTCNNLEIDKPTWYNSNGIVTLTFDDNINVFTQTQSNL